MTLPGPVEIAMSLQIDKAQRKEITMKEKTETEFEKFDKVMDGLLAVPYKELQEKIEKEKAMKAQRKKDKARAHKDNSTRADG